MADGVHVTGAGWVVDEHEPAARDEPRTNHVELGGGAPLQGGDVDREGLVVDLVPEVRADQLADDEAGRARDVPGVAPGRHGDHLPRAVDGRDAAAAVSVEPLAHQADGDAVAAPHLEDTIRGPDVEQVDRPDQTLGRRWRHPDTLASVTPVTDDFALPRTSQPSRPP